MGWSIGNLGTNVSAGSFKVTSPTLKHWGEELSNWGSEMKSWKAEDVDRDLTNLRKKVFGDPAEKAAQQKAEIESLADEAVSEVTSGRISNDEYKQRIQQLQGELAKLPKVDDAAYKYAVQEIESRKVEEWKAKAVQIGKQAETEAAQIQAVDPQKATQLFQLANQMKGQLDMSVKMAPAEFTNYVKAEAVKLGAPPNTSFNDILISSPENFVQIGTDAQQAENLKNIMQTSAANISKTVVDYDNQSLQARAQARQTGMSVLDELAKRAEGPQTADALFQQRMATEQAQKQIASQFASQRGQINPATQRAMLQQQAEAGQKVAGTSALQQQQETQRRQETLAGLALQQQQQQFTEATAPALQQAQLQQQQAIAQAQLQQQALGQSSQQTSQAILQQAQLAEAARQQQQQISYGTTQDQQQMWLQQLQMAQQGSYQQAQLQQQAAQGNQQAAMALLQQQYGTSAAQNQQQAQLYQQSMLANQAAGQQAVAQGYDWSKYQSDMGLQQQQLQAQQQQFWQNQILQQQQMSQQQNIAEMQTKAGLKAQEMQSKAAISTGNAQGQAAAQGAGIGAIGTVAAAYFSDKTTKNKVEDVNNKDLQKFFAALKGKSYQYKDEKYGSKGKHTGFLTQDIAKTKLGKDIVHIDEATGKQTYDAQKLLGIIAAQVAHLSKKEKK
jgi:hypothetical protein